MNLSTRLVIVLCLLSPGVLHAQKPKPAPTNAPPSAVVLPLDRTAYFIGEAVPLALAGTGGVTLEAVNAAGRLVLYKGPAGAVWLDTARLAPGDYALVLNGTQAVDRFTLTRTLRKSAGSLQDESLPGQMPPDEAHQAIRESGLTACVALGASGADREPWLDTLARSGALLLINPETRPTSFFPAGNHPEELDGMSQRMILTAQANGRYPNFGGFCYGWDTTGYAVGGRRGLLTYWGWGSKTQAVRNYIERMDNQKMEEFTRRTGLKPVTEEEYLTYLLSIGRPELGTAIDLPTKLWLDDIARHSKPMSVADRAAFETRLDAWSAYLMGLYNEAYSTYGKNLRAVDPALRNSSSVQSDHCAVRLGQHFPSAYAPLDFQYQSTWNDQVGGPDYAYQWLLVEALLEMERGGKPTWISSALGTAHGRATFPGKFTRVAAHGLAFGGSGIGFALEGFSNILGGMDKGTHWKNIKGRAGEADVLAGRDFLDRFAALAVEGRGAHGVGILWSKTQYGRQHVAMGYGRGPYSPLVALTRLGYTPRFVTEDEIAAGRAGDVAALLVLGQTFALPGAVNAGLAAYVGKGGCLFADPATTVEITGAEKLALPPPPAAVGKPHNWLTPSMPGNDNDVILYERQHPALAGAFLAALGDTGHAWLRAETGAATKISLLQIDGGRDARYVVAVNDSWVATQADWHQVRERLVPLPALPDGWVMYDCTAEQPLGRAAPVDCDLSLTTARVFGFLPREAKAIALAATQSATAGGEIVVRVEFTDADGARLAAVLPFHLSLIRPDGGTQAEFYRSTTREGTFAMALPVGANEPAGQWSVAVRSQLAGDVATLPVRVAAAKPAAFAAAQADPVVIRNRAALEALLVKGAKVVLPVFDEGLMPAAGQVKATLAARGVEVEIRQEPVTNTYTIAYDPVDTQKLENVRADSGETFGRIRRETANGNDWASALSGWRFGKPVILLDLVGGPGGNPMVRSLTKAGLLWPAVSKVFPGQGRAVVQAVSWAFAPRTTALVIQSADVEGLAAGARALADLPADRLTPAIEQARTALWAQYHIGGKPVAPAVEGLTAKGLATRRAPQPFVLAFPEAKPLAADQVKHPEPRVNPAYPVPGVFTQKQFIVCYRIGDETVETATAGMLMGDLRFSQAIKLVGDVKTAGKVNVTATGVFRYSDRKPCWQAQWEDIINLRERLVPVERRPMEIEVLVGGRPVGRLVPVKTVEMDVPLELAARSAGLKPRSVVEEVVTEVAGPIELPAGRQEIVLIHHNIVDGKLAKVAVGE